MSLAQQKKKKEVLWCNKNWNIVHFAAIGQSQLLEKYHIVRQYGGSYSSAVCILNFAVHYFAAYIYALSFS